MSEEFFDDENYKAYHWDRMRTNPINGDYYHIWIHKVVEKLNNGEDVVIMFCGEKGNGKSYGALRFAEILYDELNVFKGEFDVDRNFVYDPLDYLDIMRNIELPDNLDSDINPNRELIAIDEINNLAHKKDYYDEMNDAIADVLNIQRKANVCLTLIGPRAGELDARIKDDVDFVVEFIDTGVAKVTGYGFQHGNLDARNRYFVDFNRQELLVNPNLSYENDWGGWFPEKPSDDKLEVFTKLENEFKKNVPDEKYKEIQKKREEEGDEKSEADKKFEEALESI